MRLRSRSFSLLAAAVALGGGSTSCSVLRPGRPSGPTVLPATAATPEYLGTVYVIGTANKFILVQTPADQRAAALHDGQTLFCQVDGRPTATLRVSKERRPPFVVADVVSGEPHVGEEVYVELPPPSATPAPTPVQFHANPAPAAPR